MELSAGWVSAIAAVFGGFIFPLLSNQIRAVKSTQKVLFDKLDKVTSEFNAYKVHVAETYVAEAKLEKMLQPIERRLEAIEDDLRGSRKRA